MLVRSQVDADEPAVSAVLTAAFADGGAIARLVVVLRSLISEAVGASLVAEVEGTVVGHVMFTPGLLDAPRRLVEVAVLGPLAVAPAHQHTGVGSALVTAGIARMAEQRAPIVFLEGAPSYYARFGFVAGGEHGFRKPSLRIPDAAFQALPLDTFEPWMTGTLVYAHAFWEADAVGLRDADADA